MNIKIKLYEYPKVVKCSTLHLAAVARNLLQTALKHKVNT